MTTTLAHRVVTGLKDQITSGELPPGTKLPSESRLIETYAVSRTVVREAVSRLSAEGLVETHQGRGSFVLAVPEPSSFSLAGTELRTHRDVLDMIDLRLGIEAEGAALAAARITPARAAAVADALAAFSTAGPEDAVAADFGFHRTIAEAAGNRFLLELLDSFGPMMIMLPRTRLPEEYSLTDAEHVERVRREHENVAAAVRDGDPEGARAAMRVHLGNTRRRLEG